MEVVLIIQLVLVWFITAFKKKLKKHAYRKTSSISRTKSQNLNVSRLRLQWPLPNPLNPGVKLRMKM